MEKKEMTQQANQKSRILDPNFKYVPAAATDVRQTWRRFGWTPIESPGKHYTETKESKQ